MKKILLIALVLLLTVGCGGSDDSLSYEEKVYLVICRAQTWMCDDEELRQDFIKSPGNVDRRLYAFDPERSGIVTSSFNGALQTELLKELRNMDIGHKRYYSTHSMLELSIERWIQTAQTTREYLSEEELYLARLYPDYFRDIRISRAKRASDPPLGYYGCEDVINYLPRDYSFRQPSSTSHLARQHCHLLIRENTVLEQIMDHFIILSRTEEWKDSYDQFLAPDSRYRGLVEKQGRIPNPH